MGRLFWITGWAPNIIIKVFMKQRHRGEGSDVMTRVEIGAKKC